MRCRSHCGRRIAPSARARWGDVTYGTKAVILGSWPSGPGHASPCSQFLEPVAIALRGVLGERNVLARLGVGPRRPDLQERPANYRFLACGRNGTVRRQVVDGWCRAKGGRPPNRSINACAADDLLFFRP